jgi:hypothetical protein
MFEINNNTNFIDIHLGMKYDLSNSIKASIIESFQEFKKEQISKRNYLVLCNRNEKEEKQQEDNAIYKKNKIYKIKKRDIISLDFTDEEHIPKGYYCYPIKGSYFQKSSLEMPFFPLLTFKKFKEAIETFPDQNNLSDGYQSYPCLLKEDFFRIKNIIIRKYNNRYQNKPIFEDINNEKDYIPIRPSHCTHNINKLFVIWCFIKIIKGQIIIMDKDFYEIYKSDNNKIIIPIINEMSCHLKIDSNILYYIINNFLNELNKKIKKDSLIKSGISYKKYDKYWCRICKKFCCSFHFKVKIKTKNLDNNKIRIYVEYFKKI